MSGWSSPSDDDAGQIRTTSTIGGPYQLQEDGHASYWGQKAMRNCFRLVYNAGSVRGGDCVLDRKGLNSFGEPRMKLTNVN